MKKEEKIHEEWLKQLGVEKYNEFKDKIQDSGCICFIYQNTGQFGWTKILQEYYYDGNFKVVNERWLIPKSLEGIENNNGWNSIEEKGLPECEKTVIWLRDEGEPPIISSMLDEDFYGVDYFTHWMEIASKPPIY